jgi:hypothetical protein
MADAAHSLVDRVMADLPSVHLDEEVHGVWHTDRECYELMAGGIEPGSRTLETGLGVSTVLFAMAGCDHTCVTWEQAEVDRLLEYCLTRQVDTSRIDFRVGPSDEVLPTLPRSELDLVFIDGGHGFPTPMLDWFYGASRLRRGGLLVVDDNQLPAVQLLTSVLDADERWSSVARSNKWAAYRRESEGTLREEFWRQEFLRPPGPATSLVVRVRRRLREALTRKR